MVSPKRNCELKKKELFIEFIFFLSPQFFETPPPKKTKFFPHKIFVLSPFSAARGFGLMNWFQDDCMKSVNSDLIPSQNLSEDGTDPRQICRNFPKGEGEQVCDIGIGTCIYAWFPALRAMSGITGLEREPCL